MPITIEDVKQSKECLEEKLKAIEKEIAEMTQSKLKLWKAMANVNKHLNSMCDHEWKRDGYMYSPLSCAKCGVER